jgi:drug/metabolite transporter (DMT)-like permease
LLCDICDQIHPEPHLIISSDRFWRSAAPALFVVLWSSGFAFVALGLRDVAPMTFLALRFVLVVAVLAALFALLRPPLPARRSEMIHLVAVGLLLQAAYFGLLYLAIGRISAASSALVVSLQPILVGAAAPRLTGERPSRRQWLGLALGLLGAGSVIVARASVQAPSATGLICAIGALLGITGGTLYEKRFGTDQHPVSANLVQYSAALVVILPCALIAEGFHVQWTQGLVISLAYLVVGNSLVSVTLLLAMIRRGAATRVSALFFLVPPIAALIAWALLAEPMPAMAWAGLAIAATGVGLATR